MVRGCFILPGKTQKLTCHQQIQYQVHAFFVSDVLRGDERTEVRVRLIRIIEEESVHLDSHLTYSRLIVSAAAEYRRATIESCECHVCTIKSSALACFSLGPQLCTTATAKSQVLDFGRIEETRNRGGQGPGQVLDPFLASSCLVSRRREREREKWGPEEGC